MCNFLKVVFSGCVVLLCLSSCRDYKMQSLGYTGFQREQDRWENGDVLIANAAHFEAPGSKGLLPEMPVYFYAYQEPKKTKPLARETRARNYNCGGGLIYNAAGFCSHSHYNQRDSTRVVFCPEGYVSEYDINELKKKLQTITKRTLNRILASMRKEVYVYDNLTKVYSRILSNGVKDKVMAVKPTSIFTDLGGWQMFKPVDGIDSNDIYHHPYKVKYKGDEWYEITAPQIAGATPVHVKVRYAGKYFNSIIIGLKNEKAGVDIYDTDYTTRYNNKMLTLTPFDDIAYTYMYMKFLGPIVYKEAGNNGLFAEADFDRITKKVTAKEKAFVHEFYDALLHSGNNLRKIEKKYHYQMVRYLATKADEQIKKSDYSVDLFLPCSYDDFTAGYDVEYLGSDTYKVTARKNGKSIFLIVALYSKKQIPAIMAMKNLAKGIDYCPDRFMWSEKIEEYF